MKPSEVLRKAAHVMMERGLTRHRYEGGGGRVCALGAINKVMGATGRDIYQARSVLDYNTVTGFNDEEAERAHDVASLLMSEAEVVE